MVFRQSGVTFAKRGDNAGCDDLGPHWTRWSALLATMRVDGSRYRVWSLIGGLQALRSIEVMVLAAPVGATGL